MKRKLVIILLAVISCIACLFGLTACDGDKSDDTGNMVAVTSVTLSRSSLSLEVGGSDILYATVLPTYATERTVTWRSSDPSVVTVVGGKVSAISTGVANISASAGGKMATCKVTVTGKNNGKVDVTSIALNKTSLALKVGESETLTATVYPSNATENSVTWQSSDDSVVTVLNGTVTAIKAGSATVTATAGGKSATCEVTVTEKLHIHRLEYHSQTEPTCIKQGNIEYYYCVDCKKFFADNAATVEIVSVTIPATGHSFNTEKWLDDETYHWHPASCEHTDEISEKVKHTFVDNICTVCGYDANRYVTVWGNKNPIAKLKIDSDNKIQLPEDITTNPNSTKYFDGWFYDKALTLPITDFIFTESTDIYTTVYPVTSTNYNYLKFTLSNGAASVSGLGPLGELLAVIIIPRRYNGLPVTSIGEHVFQKSQATKIIMTDDIKTIGTGAFNGCGGLTYVRIPDSVTSIGDWAFCNCSSLTSVTIPGNVTIIDEHTFYQCSSLTSVTLSNGVTKIGYGAFYRCSSLTDINIPASVTSIVMEAFVACRSLVKINYGGTKAQWNSVRKGDFWNSSTGDYTVYCTDGQIKKS